MQHEVQMSQGLGNGLYRVMSIKRKKKKKNKDIKNSLSERIGKTVRMVSPSGTETFLFGSRARGDARRDSDWDVLILLDKNKITSADHDNISYPVRELGWEVDAEINPIMYTKTDWESKKFTPFYKNVMKEGIRL